MLQGGQAFITRVLKGCEEAHDVGAGTLGWFTVLKKKKEKLPLKKALHLGN